MSFLHLKKTRAPAPKNNADDSLSRMAGFTLIELAVVMSMLAILSAIAAPSLIQWNANRRLMGQAREFFSQMQLAKLQAVRNNCDVVVSLDPANNNYQIFLDNGGTIAGGIARNETRDGNEAIVASIGTTHHISLEIEASQFGGTTTPGFTSRALPLQGRTGNVVFRRNARTDRWYRVRLLPSGQLSLQMSSDSTDGQDGNWK